MSKLIVPIACDHRGFPLKAVIVAWLRDNGYQPLDLGTDSEARCDAFDYARKVSDELKKDASLRGILICGTGQAMAMTANRYRHVRAALCANATMAKMARQHNDANVLALGAHITGELVALDCVEAFLKTDFLGGRYAERRDALTAMGGVE
ncbi:MAG: ribose 5-phosphate isomerase B [Bdellovibrionales bacterium]